MLDGVPDAIELGQVDEYLRSLPNVESVHDLHVWATSTAGTALTVHMVMPSGYPEPTFLDGVAHELHDRFEITHSTIQVETVDLGDECARPLLTRDRVPEHVAFRRALPL